MRLFVFLHVLSMVTAVTLAYGPGLLVRRAIATQHVPTIRAVTGLAGSFGRLIPIFFLVGLGFAILAIITEGFNPLQPWLLIAYVLFAAGMVSGGAVTGPWVGRVHEAALASPDAVASSELRAASDDPRQQLLFYLELAIVALILFDMIVKPFS